MSKATEIATIPAKAPSLVQKMAARFSVDGGKLLDTLKATAFKAGNGVTNEQMMALLVVADQYGLNPFTREIYAFPDKGGIVPVVGVDGWSRIINSHEQFDGVDFDQDDNSCTCTIYRKDRSHPTKVTEYHAECRRDTAPWKSHPRRMLRHKTLIQCARLAFGFVGIFDEDEAQRIVERDITPAAQDDVPARSRLKDSLRRRALGPVAEAEGVDEPGAPPAPAMTYAEVAERIQRATTQEQRDEAASLIGMVADERQRAELSAMHDALPALAEESL